MTFRYGPTARFFHWTTVILVVVMFALGAWIKDFEPQNKAFKLELLNLHQSFGVLLFVVVVLRLFVRVGNPPPLLSDQPALIRVGSRLNHYALYAMLLNSAGHRVSHHQRVGYSGEMVRPFHDPVTNRQTG